MFACMVPLKLDFSSRNDFLHESKDPRPLKLAQSLRVGALNLDCAEHVAYRSVLTARRHLSPLAIVATF